MTMAVADTGRAIVEAIEKSGSRYVFAVPGESLLGVLDAFNDSGVEVIPFRIEQGAGFAALAYARITGRPGFIAVSRGPGLSNASIAVHCAWQDSLPLVVLTGQVPSKRMGRDAFQEVDVPALGRLLGKGGVSIARPEDAALVIKEAIELATSGKPGPVVVEIPEDVANSVPGTFARSSRPLVRNIADQPGNAVEVVAVAEVLKAANRIAYIVGYGALDATAEIESLLSRCPGPVYTEWRAPDAFPNRHPYYAGTLPWLPDELLGDLRNADLVVALGSLLDDQTSLRYTLPGDGQRLLIIDPRSDGHGPATVVRAPVGETLRVVNAGLEPVTEGPGEEMARTAHSRFQSSRVAPPRRENARGVPVAEAILALSETMPEDAIITCDAGAFAAFLHRYYVFPAAGTFVGTKAGAMGVALPAAIGSRLAAPHRHVVAVAGDGGFAMTMSELLTARLLDLVGITVLLLDNSCYGSIAKAQLAFGGPDRLVGVRLADADFATIARGMGAEGVTVSDADSLRDALRQSLDLDRVTVIHVRADPDDLSPGD